MKMLPVSSEPWQLHIECKKQKSNTLSYDQSSIIGSGSKRDPSEDLPWHTY